MESRSELNDKNIKKVCRTCLTINTEQMISIFNEIEQVGNDENVINICDLLMDVALIEVDPKESLPTLICINCLRLVQILSNFRKQCIKSQAILFEYLTEKQDKIIIKESSNEESNILNKKPTPTELVDIEMSLNEDEHSMIVEKDVDEIINSSSPDDLINTCLKLELVDVESETGKEYTAIKTLDAKESLKEDGDILNKKSAITELIDTERTLNEIKHESITIENEGPELSNPSSSDYLLNASIKLGFCDEIIKSNAGNECKETLLSMMNYENVFTCRLCDASFKTDALYFAHLKQHSEEPHLRTHDNEKRYSCKICGRRYKYVGSLTIHMRTHPGETKFLCTVCHSGFRTSNNLKLHMRTHTKEKSFMCNICGIAMSRKGDFTRHMKIHAGKKPYKCIECSEAFNTSNLLKKHSIVHTLKSYSCDVCKKCFNKKSVLTIHEKTHRKKRPHVCPLCNKSYIHEHSLRFHLQTHLN